ncbi:hypothetical protein dsat_1478 [Alkalidesulfovibrio alkalitolerans DSM 16529]|uniref:Uncharacterized protein n=1 Tax=Alkalidesulfovibrio alkalitolerans DSM 16529 TaxID=1121439 RepID=S7UDQ3_9BACT|nr:hypothetical protein [Alkalidesulfovibrio alkalitolerans]EPR30338.1 hypothetical protein dsat_1478 [Alkalidesulfovibrio alkalitolerans DSM 16529]
MRLEFDTRGLCCDLALHPVSGLVAKKMQKLGKAVYRHKYANWWRKGNTTTCGMRVDPELLVRVRLDGAPQEFDQSGLTREVFEVRRRMYLESNANYACVLGYDNEPCGCVWRWNDISDFDPARFTFQVQRWDSIMGEKDYFILDNVLYDGHFADEHAWCDSKGFDLIRPIVINLGAVRREMARAV